MSPNRLLIACSATVVAVLLTGCSGPSTGSESGAADPAAGVPPSADATPADLPETAPPSPGVADSPGVANDVGVDAPCELLDEATVARVVGEKLRERSEGAIGKIPGCLWGSLEGPGLQVASVPAEVWGASIPEMLDGLLDSGSSLLDEENLARLEEAKGLVSRGELLTAVQACEVFSSMAELNGQEPGSDFTVNYIPDLDDPMAVSGQACVDGQYHSVLVVGPQVEVAPETEAHVVDVLGDLASR